MKPAFGISVSYCKQSGQGRNRYTYSRSFDVSYCFFVAPYLLERPYQQISGTKLAHFSLAADSPRL